MIHKNSIGVARVHTPKRIERSVFTALSDQRSHSNKVFSTFLTTEEYVVVESLRFNTNIRFDFLFNLVLK